MFPDDDDDDDDSILEIHLIRTVSYLARHPGPQAMVSWSNVSSHTQGKRFEVPRNEKSISADVQFT